MKRRLTRTRLRVASAWGVKSVMTQFYHYRRRHLGSYSLIALQSCRYPRLQWLTAATKRQAWMFSPNTDPTVPHALCCLIVNNQPFTHQRLLQHKFHLKIEYSKLWAIQISNCCIIWVSQNQPHFHQNVRPQLWCVNCWNVMALHACAVRLIMGDDTSIGSSCYLWMILCSLNAFMLPIP